MIVDANGSVEAEEEGTVYVNDLDIFICVKLVENSPAGTRLGNVEMGYSNSRKAGEQPQLTSSGVTIIRRSDNHVPIVAVDSANGNLCAC